MRIANEFTVPTSVENAWRVLTDLEGIAPCMPGARLTGVDGDVYNGKVKVKVGPVISEFAGTARFTEKDDAAYRAVIDAKGRDPRSAGNAAALVTAVLTPDGDRTRVSVDTDLKISGKLAQFGSGMIKEVSGKLLDQFVKNLETKLAADPTPAAAPPAAGPPASALSATEAEAEAPEPPPTTAPAAASAAAASSPAASQAAGSPAAASPVAASPAEASLAEASPTAASSPAASQAAGSPPAASTPAASQAAASPAAASSPTASSPTASSPTASSPTASSPTASSPTASSPAASSPAASSPAASSPTASSPAASPPATSPPAASPAAGKSAAASADIDDSEALDLLGIAGSSVYKRLVPLAVGVVAVGAVIVWLVVRG